MGLGHVGGQSHPFQHQRPVETRCQLELNSFSPCMARSRGRGRLAFVRNSSHGCRATKPLRSKTSETLTTTPKHPGRSTCENIQTTVRRNVRDAPVDHLKLISAEGPESSWGPSLLNRIGSVSMWRAIWCEHPVILRTFWCQNLQ